MIEVEVRQAPAEEEGRSKADMREWQTVRRQILELAPDAVVVGDADHGVTDVNAAACELLGFSREEFVGKRFQASSPRRGEDSSARFLAVPGLVHTGEWRVKRADGTLVPIEVSVKALPDRGGLGFIRDITERKRDERERDESLRWMRAVLDQFPLGWPWCTARRTTRWS